MLTDFQVMVDVDDKNEWRECIDIGGVRLPTGYFFGASAATGDLSGGCEEVWGVFSGPRGPVRHFCVLMVPSAGSHDFNPFSR